MSQIMSSARLYELNEYFLGAGCSHVHCYGIYEHLLGLTAVQYSLSLIYVHRYKQLLSCKWNYKSLLAVRR
jgi:hypothetical protein